MIKKVNFMLSIYYHNQKKKEKKKTSGYILTDK